MRKFYTQFSAPLYLHSALILVVWCSWLAIVGWQPAMTLLSTHFDIALTMLFGSFVAGSTSVGGGAVAFPVFTKVLEIPSSTALIFSLAIQSIGMVAASILIFANRIPVVLSVISRSVLCGGLGVVVGLLWFGDVTASADVRYLFSMFTLLVGLALIVNRWRETQNQLKQNTMEPNVISNFILLPAVFFGGVLSGIIGTGIDFVVFAVMIFVGNYGLRVAIATSVVVMAINAVIGFIAVLLLTDRFTGIVVDYWLAAVPIVVVGAPIGALACRYLPKSVMFYFLMALIVLDISSTVMVLGFRLPYIFLLVVVLGLFAAATKYQQRR